jgi:hypothetical protein
MWTSKTESVCDLGICFTNYYMLLLEPEMDSNLTWLGPQTWLGRPCLAPKVVSKEEDVLGHLLGVLQLLGVCSNLGLGPKYE